MAFLKTKRSRGNGDILINLDHVLEFRPVGSSDRRTKVTLLDPASDEGTRVFNVTAAYDTLAADWNHFGDEDTVNPLP